MKKVFLLAGLAALGAVSYGIVAGGGCGSAGALACPDPALEHGAGQVLAAAQVCPSAGYLCGTGGAFAVSRWSLRKGRVRVRVTRPPFLPEAEGAAVRDVAVAGIKAWDRRPLPIAIETSEVPFRICDVAVVWTRGLDSGYAGIARRSGAGAEFDNPEIAVTAPPDLAAEGWRRRVWLVAAHEMGHALALGHSDDPADLMYPQMTRETSGVTARDFQTLEALYRLPNGAEVRP